MPFFHQKAALRESLQGESVPRDPDSPSCCLDVRKLWGFRSNNEIPRPLGVITHAPGLSARRFGRLRCLLEIARGFTLMVLEAEQDLPRRPGSNGHGLLQVLINDDFYVFLRAPFINDNNQLVIRSGNDLSLGRRDRLQADFRSFF